jgi:hypothetical protein
MDSASEALLTPAQAQPAHIVANTLVRQLHNRQVKPADMRSK